MDLAEEAVRVRTEADPTDKVALSLDIARRWRAGGLSIGNTIPPDRPARPEAPALLPPRDMARRRVNRNPAGRIALLHAVAHIELNAIDLAWDLVARFPGPDLPRGSF